MSRVRFSIGALAGFAGLSTRRVITEPLGDHGGRDFEVKLHPVNPIAEPECLMRATGGIGQQLGVLRKLERLPMPVEENR